MESNRITRLSASLYLLAGLVIALTGLPAWAQVKANLESPVSTAYLRSGIALIRGWACQASRVEVRIDDGPLLLTAYGTNRPDTATVCDGRTSTGFGLLYNWNRLGDGPHTIQAFADGEKFASANFVVTTLGSEYLQGVSGEYTVPDFPNAGRSTTIRWSESDQNFVIVSAVPVPSVSNPPNKTGMALESPTQGGSESGIGLIRGWVCTASKIQVRIDDGELLLAAYGTDRPDTSTACGHTNTGFGLTYNWNRLADGVHSLHALADGVEFANVNFAVTTLGSEYLAGLAKKILLLGFPGNGTATTTQAAATTSPTTTLQWSEPDQNFIISSTTATGEKVALISAVTDVLNHIGVLGVGSNQTDSTGMYTEKNASGMPTRVNGISWTALGTGHWTDLSLNSDGLPDTYRDSNGNQARFSQFTSTSVVISFFDQNGKPVGKSVTASIAGSVLQQLQALVKSVRDTASTQISIQSQLQAGTPGLFSLKSLLVQLFAMSGAAEGGLLCALQSAGATAGAGNLVASTACQSELLKNLTTLVSTGTQKVTMADALDNPALQRALEFSEDVPQATCGTPGDNAACLDAAAAVLQTRAAEPVSMLSPNLAASYSGTQTLCVTVSATFGHYGSCGRTCASASASVTLNGDGSILVGKHYWTNPYNFDYDGNCLENSIKFSDELDSYTYHGAYANGTIIIPEGIDDGYGNISRYFLQGSYDEKTLSATGSVIFSTTFSTATTRSADHIYENTLSLSRTSP